MMEDGTFIDYDQKFPQPKWTEEQFFFLKKNHWIEDWLPDGTKLYSGVYHQGVLSHWTGKACAKCNGTGEDCLEARSCPTCGGTGDDFGPVWLVEI